MKNEERIMSTLELIIERLDEHSKRFDMIDKRFDANDRRFDEIDQRFDQIDQRFDANAERFDTIDGKLQEHSEHLSALRTGQEFLKAELDGMKIANAKEFGTVKQQIDDLALNFGLLRDDVWKNKVDIERIKNTMGMA